MCHLQPCVCGHLLDSSAAEGLPACLHGWICKWQIQIQSCSVLQPCRAWPHGAPVTGQLWSQYGGISAPPAAGTVGGLQRAGLLQNQMGSHRSPARIGSLWTSPVSPGLPLRDASMAAGVDDGMGKPGWES